MADADRDIFQSALSDFTFEAACGGAIRHLADSGCTAKQILERLDYPISGERVRKALYRHLCDTDVILEKSPEEGLPGAKPEYVIEYNSYGKPSYRRKNTENAEKSLANSNLTGAVWKEMIYRPTSGLSESISDVASVKTLPHSGRGLWSKPCRDSSQGMRSKPCRDSGQGMRSKPGRDSSQGMRSKPGRDSGQSNAEKPTGYPGRGAELSIFLTKKCSQTKEEQAYLSCDFGIPDSAAARGISLLNERQREYLEGILWPRRRIYHRLDHRMKEILCSLYEQGAYEGICYFPASREKLLITLL